MFCNISQAIYDMDELVSTYWLNNDEEISIAYYCFYFDINNIALLVNVKRSSFNL